MRISARALATARLRDLEPDALLKSKLREIRQWSPCSEDQVIRYDFAFVDPVNGRTVQYITETTAHHGVSEAELCERVVPVARSAIARLLRQKCGIRQAITNQYPLLLPRGVEARYV